MSAEIFMFMAPLVKKKKEKKASRKASVQFQAALLTRGKVECMFRCCPFAQSLRARQDSSIFSANMAACL